MNDAVYDELAALESTHWWFQGRRRILRDVLARRLPDRSLSIVDVGCGTGELTDMLREFGPVVGLDASPLALRHCQARFGDLVDLRLGRIPQDVPAGADLITAFDVVEHLEDDAGALAGIHQRLAPGGLFVMTVPAFGFLWSAHDEVHHHFRRYNRRQLRGLLEEAGFQVERIGYFNTLLFPAVAAIRLLQRSLKRDSAASSDVQMPGPRVNRALTAAFGAERWALRVTSFPVGVSLMAVARKAR